MRSNLTTGDADLDRAVWFNTGIDPETGETTLFLHTASENLTYVLKGNSSGFVAEGGEGTIEEYQDLGRVKLYEYVSDYTDVYDINLSSGANGEIQTAFPLPSPRHVTVFVNPGRDTSWVPSTPMGRQNR